VKEFLDKKADMFPNLEHKHTPGLDPVLRMKTASGDTEEFSISQFSTEDIVEFLTTKFDETA